MVDKGSERADVGAISGKELALLPSSSSAGPSASYPAIAASSKFYPYPPPLAKYEDIVADPNTFMKTLEKLHGAMRTKFMVPIIGGKELDLHRLFVEVTARGGIEKVVRERRWKEITSVFKFPSTATNASFILRKYYVALIHHYEQLYYFGAKGWNRPETDHLPSPSPAPNPVQSSVAPLVPSPEVKGSSVQPQSRVNHPLGTPVVGVIDGKFEHGYLVTISIGSQKLHGVMYHISELPADQAPMYPFLGPNSSSKVTVPSVVRRRRRRKKSEIKRRDPAHPKPNRSGYNFFFQEHHARLKPLHPGKDREISKMIGELWSKLTETEKAVYQERGLRDKERYQFEMQEYRERLKRGQIISDAVPIQQRHAEPEVGMAEQDKKMDTEEDKLEGEDDESEEDDPMEADSPHTPENESISAGSDSQDKTADKNTEMEIATEAVHRAESGNGAAVDNDFELRKRDQKEGVEPSVQDLNL